MTQKAAIFHPPTAAVRLVKAATPMTQNAAE